MKIIFNQNPLKSIVELTQFEKKELWYKVMVERVTELLFSVNFHLSDHYFDLERAKHLSNPDYYISDEGKSELEKSVDQLAEGYIDELSKQHCGDCICVACSCMKCHAEGLLGINTIKGLGKHEANHIVKAFNDGRGIDQALIYLKNYNPSADWDGWEKHAERWKKESERAYKWLTNYKENILIYELDK